MKSGLFLATIMLGTGLFSGGSGAVRAVPAVGVTIAALIAASVYLAEHDIVPGVYPEVATVATFLVTVGVGLPHRDCVRSMHTERTVSSYSSSSPSASRTFSPAWS